MQGNEPNETRDKMMAAINATDVDSDQDDSYSRLAKDLSKFADVEAAISAGVVQVIKPSEFRKPPPRASASKMVRVTGTDRSHPLYTEESPEDWAAKNLQPEDAESICRPLTALIPPLVAGEGRDLTCAIAALLRAGGHVTVALGCQDIGVRQRCREDAKIAIQTALEFLERG